MVAFRVFSPLPTSVWQASRRASPSRSKSLAKPVFATFFMFFVVFVIFHVVFCFFNKKKLIFTASSPHKLFHPTFSLTGLLPRFAGVAQRRWQQTPLAESICIRPAVALDFGFLETPGCWKIPGSTKYVNHLKPPWVIFVKQ